MNTNVPRSNLLTYLMGLLVLVAALGIRIYYLHEYQVIAQPGAQTWQVQGRGVVLQPPDVTELDQLVANLKQYGIPDGFKCLTPLGPEKEETTAHRAPLYPVFRAVLETGADKVSDYITLKPFEVVRYVQAVLGALTCLLYYMIAWRAFGHLLLLALLVGLVTAAYPFWVINVGELEDGTLTSFLLAWSLYLGLSAGQQGGTVRGLFMGLVLAALSLTRAALLPLAIVIQLWYCLRCRRVSSGAMSAILMLIGFAGGMAPWIYHGYQTFQTPVPVITTAWFHLWVGNNSASDGADYQWSMKKRLDPALLTKLAQTPQQDRYALLAETVATEVIEKPWEAVNHRLKAAMQFLFGTNTRSTAMFWPGNPGQTPPDWLRPVLMASLMAMFALALLGWRWSFAWKYSSAPLSLAIFWLPIPYLLSHAGTMHSARLPLDGVILVLACIGYLGIHPIIGRKLLQGESHEVNSKST